MLQPAQRGGRQHHSPTWVSVTHSTLTSTMLQQSISDILLNVVQGGTHPLAWPGCCPQHIPPSHWPIPPWPFHIHQNQKYMLSEENKPECFKFWSGWFSPKCRGDVGLHHLAISSPLPYSADLIYNPCLGEVFILFPSPPEEKESLLLHTLRNF